MSAFEKNITADYLRKVAEQGKLVKDTCYRLLKLSDVKNVLDVGCGPGVDTIPMSQQIGVGGTVTGIDISQEMIAQANTFAVESGVSDKVTHLVGSVSDLPFDPETFDAVHTERLFQVLPKSEFDPQTVFQNLDKVLKPTGRMVLADTDWSTVSLALDDIEMERKFTRFFTDVCRPNGYAGRQFYGWLKSGGYTDITVDVLPQTMYDMSMCPLGEWLIDEAMAKDFCSAEEADVWMKALSDKQASGIFFGTVNMVVVSGVKTK